MLCCGEMVVDFCVGVGGKMFVFGVMMCLIGCFYVFDVLEKCFVKLKLCFVCSGLLNVNLVLIDSEYDVKIKCFVGKIDCVLVDVLCSGFGMLCCNLDFKWC